MSHGDSQPNEYVVHTMPPILQEIVNEAIARAHRNVADDLPFTAGCDVDDVLLRLNLPMRAATCEPTFLPADILHESGPRRNVRRRTKKPAA